MTPVQLFLASLFAYWVFKVLSHKEVLKRINNTIIEFFILLIFFLSVISLVGSVFWGIFYYIKI